MIPTRPDGLGLALLIVGHLLAAAAAGGAVYLLATAFAPRLRERMRREEEALGDTFRDLFLSTVTPRAVVVLQYIGAPLSALVVYLAAHSPVFALLVGALVWVAPRLVLRRVRRRRRERLERQVLDLITSFSATTKAGMSLVQSVEEVAERMPPPMSQEFRIVRDRLRAGQTLERALTACEERVGIPNLGLVLQSILVNEERGGPLPRLLERIHTSLREIERVEERVRTETSGIRLSSRIMAAMPLLVGLLLYLVSPENVTMLFDTLAGNLILVAALAMDFLGFMMIRRYSRLGA